MNWLRQVWHFVIINYFVFFWVPVYAYMGMIFQLSSMPNPMSLPAASWALFVFGSSATYVLHTLEYLGLSFILAVALRHSRHEFLIKHSYIIGFAIAALFGISDEIHQIYVPGRECSIWDMGADSLGAFLAQAARKIIKLEKNYMDKIF